MDAATISRLNAINREFYRITADSFDQTRGAAWPGWKRSVPYLHFPLSVLDVGCGNGRFALFLHSIAPADAGFHYTGLDSNPALLSHAHDALKDTPHLNLKLEARDILEQPLLEGEYDLVTLFGVLHHIPGSQQRQQFMSQWAARLKPGGLLAFSAWRFYEYERFRQRIVPWPDDIQVEEHDYLLDWRRGETALRYCHYTDDAEHQRLVASSGLQEIIRYRADGEGGSANCYSLLQK